MRLIPDSRFAGMPCSYTGTATAYGKTTGKVFVHPFPEGLKKDGWLTLDDENKYIRKYLSIRKKQYFKRGERVKLRDFLESNSEKCCICVLGHFLYADGKDYWSFFNNDNDDVVCVWYIRD